VSAIVSIEPEPIKDRFQMVEEFFREAAVLVLVFAILDRVLKGDGLRVWQLLIILGVSGLCLAVGVKLEEWRPQ
jgi:hypothetical protein